MLVRFYWPDCDFFDAWGHKCTAFWIECTEDESKKEIFPRLRQDQVERAKRYAQEHCFDLDEISRPFCFLASKDLDSIETTPMHYPYANLWNGYSPFKELESPIEIAELDGITLLSILGKA